MAKKPLDHEQMSMLRRGASTMARPAVAAALAFSGLLGSGTGVAAAEPVLVSIAPAPPPGTVHLQDYPFVPADSSGMPTIACGPNNDGENVRTYDAYHGEHIYVCRFNQPVFADPYWEWLEVVG